MNNNMNRQDLWAGEHTNDKPRESDIHQRIESFFLAFDSTNGAQWIKQRGGLSAEADKMQNTTARMHHCITHFIMHIEYVQPS
jgi:hypothetical protein